MNREGLAGVIKMIRPGNSIFKYGYYLRNKKLGVVSISLECPFTLWNIDDFQEKALALSKSFNTENVMPIKLIAFF